MPEGSGRHVGAVRVLGLACVALLGGMSTAIATATVIPSTAGASGIIPPGNPAANIPFLVAPDCITGAFPDNSTPCISSLLTDIDHARAEEGVGPMSLPPGFAAMPANEQTWAVINLERQDRGLPIFPQLDGVLSAAATSAAAAEADPLLPRGYPATFSWGSIAAWGEPNVLYADYDWMYFDGPGGVNIDCLGPGGPGCWAHRDNILGNYTGNGDLVIGTGSAAVLTDCLGWCPSYTALMGNSSQSTQDPLYSWSSVDPPSSGTGYDIVGSDGGVFVLPVGQSNGFYGSLPQIGVQVHDIVGMVPSADGHGYFLVGSDGGVFSFGDTHFEGSLPGMGVNVSDIVGIVPTADDRGYFLVGADGGVFTFGDAHYEGSLPGLGLHIGGIAGIAATADDSGYWLVAASGQVFSFGDAATYGSAPSLGAPATAITGTRDGRGYWVVAANGNVATFGDAVGEGSLPGDRIAPALPVVALVPTGDDGGYWMVGSDGGVFSFGDAVNVGSLPGLGIRVGDVVGAVPTTFG